MMKILMHINYHIMKEKRELVYLLWDSKSYCKLGKGPRFIYFKILWCTQQKKAIVALREMRQWKQEIVEDYYDIFL